MRRPSALGPRNGHPPPQRGPHTLPQPDGGDRCRSCVDSASVFPIRPGIRFRRHGHDIAHVCVVLDGGFIQREGRGWRDAGPGTIRASGGGWHDIDFGPQGARCLLLTVPDETLAHLTRPRFLAADPWLHRVTLQLAAAAAVPDDDPVRTAEVGDLGTEFLAQLLRRLHGRLAGPPPWLARVRERLEDARGAVSVAALAREAGVHRVHLARAFREHYGASVTGRARQLRLVTAVRLLGNGDLPLSQVAASAGFADQSHLTRAVRWWLGVTPANLRRRTLHPFKTDAGVPA